MLAGAGPVRFSNTGGRSYRKVEAYLVYATPNDRTTKVSFNWTDDAGEHTEEHTYRASQTRPDSSWKLKTGRKTRTNWVEMAVE